ncbi:MAG: tetratricopeptide repeat protein, partial [Blastocatellia bacterium]
MQPAFRLAAAAVLLMAVGIPGYLYWQNNQPVNRSMASLRQAWDRNRPIEARVTGDFPYLPYMVTRGAGDTVSVNEAQLLAATADLAREVADRPTPRAKHALGRLHLLKEEFDKAEKLLKEVIAEEPKNAQAHVDLASVYYERGVRAESVQSFFQAAEHLKTATEISPKLAEAWFNLALCHEQMKLTSQAITDWERYLALDSASPWANEARDHLQKLRERSQMTTPQPSKLADELLAAEAAGDESKILNSLADNFTEVSTAAWDRLLDDYLEAHSSGNRSKADQLSRLLAHLSRLIRATKEDAYFVDQFNFVKALNALRVEKV